MIARLLPIALLAIVLAGAWAAPRLSGTAGPSGPEVELALFPSGRLLSAVPSAYRTAAADLAWLRAIQYYGKHRLADRSYPMARHLFEVTTRLDPQFRNAYIFGGWILAEEAGDMAAARDLFALGSRAFPQDWMMAFQRGFLEYLRGDASLGAIEMAHAAAMPEAPPYAARVAAFACARAGNRDLALRLWEEIARDPDPVIRAIALQRLQEIRQNRKWGES